MKKIKITKEEKELEGEIEKGKVTIFGNSAHIPFSKKHLAKKVSVIIPSNPRYIWLLTESEKRKLINIASKVVKKENGKLEHYRQGLIKDLSDESFNLDSLIKIISLLELKEKEIKLVKRIKKLYNI
jgi:putative transposon-encoded protein